MRVTRRLLSIASSTSKQTKKASPSPQYKQLLQPRNQWDVLYSAISCIHSVIFDQSKRDSLVSLIDNGVINPSALGQADFGTALTLALHHDLSSELFIEKGGEFCVEEFLEGVQPALESFHEVLYSLDLAKMADLKKQLKTLQNNDGEVKTISDCDNMPENNGDIGFVERILADQSNWISTGEQDPSSLLGQLQKMTSPHLLLACETQFTGSVLHCSANKIPRMEYVKESGEISHIALLSARASEVIPSTEELGKDVTVMSDDSFSNGIEKDYPVAAQMEVIYSISQRFTSHRISDTNDAVSSNDENQIQSSWVAVFETYLSSGSGYGNCVGDGLLRWKLVENRPAWEFPGGLS